MKFLITTTPETFQSLPGIPSYAQILDPDDTTNILTALTGPHSPDVWICHGEEVTPDLLSRWVERVPSMPKALLLVDHNDGDDDDDDGRWVAQLRELAGGRLVVASVAECAVLHTGTHEEKNGDENDQKEKERILRAAEKLYAQGRAHFSPSTPPAQNANEDTNHKKTVILVGTGIVNLLTAEYLAARGTKVTLIDSGPDPTLQTPAAPTTTTSSNNTDWARLGITHGGGNARMYTHSEADNYNEKGSVIYRDMRAVFRRGVRAGGWSVKDPRRFCAAERSWVEAFEGVPSWMACAFREDIYAVNREAGRLWEEYLDQEETLFEGVELRRDILRLYAEKAACDAAVGLNGRLGALRARMSMEGFLSQNPGFASAAEADQLAGAIMVDGFTVNIHPFARRLVGRISDLGGEFIWDCEVERIQRDGSGAVTALASQRGLLTADHFVVSPGVTGNRMLQGTASENLVQGVLGVWLQIPNVEPRLAHSVKIHRRAHLVEDINVTIAKDEVTGEDILMFGGGYGYIGLDRPAHDDPELLALYQELEEVARIYFPRGYAAAKDQGSLYPGGQRRFCVRPFTPTGLGLFERIPTASGGQLIITGGNNTGGFAQAPAIARAVWRALNGEADPIHVLFHPDRGRLLRQPDTTGVTYRARSPQGSVAPRVLLLCGDGPQHRYLRYRLDQAFRPGYRCIQETTDGQVRQLVAKRRVVDACYMKYHSLRRHYTGHDEHRARYFSQLVPSGHESSPPDLVVDSVNCRQVWEAVETWQPELTIVSGTKYIGRKLMERAGLMINLHIGHLPEYKGNHCIFFALYDGALDQVSATLHQLTAELDGGGILDRVLPTVRADDSEETLYARCLHLAIDRCIAHAERFARGESLAFETQAKVGRTFRHRDRTVVKEKVLSHALHNHNPDQPDRIFSVITLARTQSIPVGKDSLNVTADVVLDSNVNNEDAIAQLLARLDFDILLVPGAPPAVVTEMIEEAKGVEKRGGGGAWGGGVVGQYL
ncbi:FAD dependent oxidoreductase-domain-containing protein [Aspergillus candidus]|uniref:FAD dependent oxidoreductase-domain-containing protein n=1 Tax=Aspergillus candidus TaxID=41067 RepID=A0A2I2FH41_ASPCN|nr:FAD dependent oxidoreductase-domain-containing protein [Aspergillus candidus]PLB39943.1 FAD dependent oxidoreductase-domain-containing protein [Aspergillus candidus]